MSDILENELIEEQKTTFKKAKNRAIYQVVIIYFISLVLMKFEFGEYKNFTDYGLLIDPLLIVLMVLFGTLPITVIINSLLYMFRKRKLYPFIFLLDTFNIGFYLWLILTVTMMLY